MDYILMIKSLEISRLLEQRELRQLKNETNKEPKPRRIDLYMQVVVQMNFIRLSGFTWCTW